MVSAGVLSHSVPLLICVSPYHWDLRRFKTSIRSTRLVSDETCPLINTTVCLTLSGSNWDSFFFSLWTVARMLAVAAVLMTIRHGDDRREGSSLSLNLWVWVQPYSVRFSRTDAPFTSEACWTVLTALLWFYKNIFKVSYGWSVSSKRRLHGHLDSCTEKGKKKGRVSCRK